MFQVVYLCENRKKIKMKVLFIVGSLREKSFNKTLAKYIDEQISPKHETKFLEYANIPFMNQDTEFPTPSEIERVREEVIWADVVWIVTPEYNGSFSGVLKNLLDWLSRPVVQGTSGAPEFIADKPVLISAATAKPNGERVLPELKQLLERMKMQVFEHTGGITLTKEAFMTGELVLTDEHKERINAQIEAFNNAF